MATLNKLKDAVIEAVALLDEADGSRVGTAQAIDDAREVLADAYGSEFDDDLAEHLEQLESEVEDDADGDGIPDDEQDD